MQKSEQFVALLLAKRCLQRERTNYFYSYLKHKLKFYADFSEHTYISKYALVFVSMAQMSLIIFLIYFV